MIFLVSKQETLFDSPHYKRMSVEESLRVIKEWKYIQFDTETTGLDPHVCELLTAQFGNKEADIQIVVDCTTIRIEEYKEVLENGLLILQNAKFDLQFMYKHNIIPLKVYDTMIAEQLLYLGYPTALTVEIEDYKASGYTFPVTEIFIKEFNGKPYYDYMYMLSYSLKAIAKKRLGIDMDKTVRGRIIYLGLTDEVIIYAANDVVPLEDIMESQLKDLEAQGLMRAIEIECNFVPVIAYLEWCGIHLDQDKWKAKMKVDQANLEKSLKELNDFVRRTDKLKQFTHIELQGDLFTGFQTEPQVDILWSSSDDVIKVAKALGFDTNVKDKKTGEDKDSVMEKVLSPQKGINDEFLKLYFKEQEYAKVVSSFGQGHLNAINPLTDRIHTDYHQLGCASGRMSCGSKSNNGALAKLKGLPIKPSTKQKQEGLGCGYPNMQQLPADEVTRGAFTAPKGYKWCSCDYSALESRLGADIYNEPSMLKEFLEGSGDMHSLCAYMVYDEIPRDTPIKDIKKLYPHLRKEVKSIELSSEDSL